MMRIYSFIQTIIKTYTRKWSRVNNQSITSRGTARVIYHVSRMPFTFRKVLEIYQDRIKIHTIQARRSSSPILERRMLIFTCENAHVVCDWEPLESELLTRLALPRYVFRISSIQNIDALESEVAEALTATKVCSGYEYLGFAQVRVCLWIYPVSRTEDLDIPSLRLVSTILAKSQRKRTEPFLYISLLSCIRDLIVMAEPILDSSY